MILLDCVRTDRAEPGSRLWAESASQWTEAGWVKVHNVGRLWAGPESSGNSSAAEYSPVLHWHYQSVEAAGRGLCQWQRQTRFGPVGLADTHTHKNIKWIHIQIYMYSFYSLFLYGCWKAEVFFLSLCLGLNVEIPHIHIFLERIINCSTQTCYKCNITLVLPAIFVTIFRDSGGGGQSLFKSEGVMPSPSLMPSAPMII